MKKSGCLLANSKNSCLRILANFLLVMLEIMTCIYLKNFFISQMCQNSSFLWNKLVHCKNYCFIASMNSLECRTPFAFWVRQLLFPLAIPRSARELCFRAHGWLFLFQNCHPKIFVGGEIRLNIASLFLF